MGKVQSAPNQPEPKPPEPNERKTIYGAAIGVVACVAALSAMQEPLLQGWLQNILGGALTPVVTGIGLLLLGTLVTLLKSLWKLLPILSIEPKDDEEADALKIEREGPEPPLGPSVPEADRNIGYYRERKEYWKQNFLRCQADSRRLVNHANQKIRDILTSANTKIERQRIEAKGGNERNAALLFALTCGITMAIASAIATLLRPPSSPEFFNAHVLSLAIAYSAVAFGFGFGAGRSLLPPNKNIALRVGGLSALYVNSVSVIINLPYSWNALFSASDTTPRIGTIPIGFLIVFARVLLLPGVSVLACWLGCIVATLAGRRSRRLRAAP